MPDDPAPASRGRKTAFGEAFWVDALKTAGVAFVTLLVMFLIGGALTLMVIAPWGRASPDCSMFCVLEQRLEAMLDDDAE